MSHTFQCPCGTKIDPTKDIGPRSGLVVCFHCERTYGPPVGLEQVSNENIEKVTSWYQRIFIDGFGLVPPRNNIDLVRPNIGYPMERDNVLGVVCCSDNVSENGIVILTSGKSFKCDFCSTEVSRNESGFTDFKSDNDLEIEYGFWRKQNP